MSKLVDELGDLWAIVVDLLTFYHGCCSMCQPWDGREIDWVSPPSHIEDVIRELVIGVCSVNKYTLHQLLDNQIISEAIETSDIYCPQCQAQWSRGELIGNSGLPADGEPVGQATHLLTKAYWPYLTHYTRGNDYYDGLDIVLKMLLEGKIEGSSKGISGGYSVVCLTECSPLEIHSILELEQMFTSSVVKPIGYKEKQQWNRSPHGIAIKRDAAIRHGALPVIHGEKRLQECLPENYKYRFVQFNHNPNNYRDWTFEREFRFLGTVDISTFCPEEISLVVENRQEQFYVLAHRNVPPCPVLAFDYIFAREYPRWRRTRRQEKVSWSDYAHSSYKYDWQLPKQLSFDFVGTNFVGTVSY